MAAVTENGARTVNAGDGALTEVIQDITIANTGDTWIPGLSTILACGSNTPAEITKMAPSTANPSVVTLTTTGAVSHALVWAKGFP